MNRRNFCKGLLTSSLTATFVPLTCFADAFGGCRRFRQMRYVMGTLLDIVVYSESSDSARVFFDRAFSIVERLDRLLSNFKESSEISLLNRGRGFIELSEDSRRILELGEKYWQLSEGYFDIGIRPLVDLWQRAAALNVLPKERELARARSLCGMKPSFLSLVDDRYSLSSKGMGVDTGGIGKGYALDLLLPLLRKSDLHSALINFGHSTVYAYRSPPAVEAWRLQLRFPGEKARGVLELKDRAASASSSFGEIQEIAGASFGHIVDPKTGMFLSEKRLAAVIASTPLEAEVLSTYSVLKGGLVEKELSFRQTDSGRISNPKTLCKNRETFLFRTWGFSGSVTGFSCSLILASGLRPANSSS